MVRIAVDESMVAEVHDFMPHSGKQIGFLERRFAVGELCRKGQLVWDRPLNTPPSSDIWQALYFSGLVEHYPEDGTDVYECGVVVGAPKNLVHAFKAALPKHVTGDVEILLPKRKSRKFRVPRIVVVPECAAHALAFGRNRHCIVISIGLGTVELGAATGSGVLPNSLHSINYGLHRVAIEFRNQLRAIGFDNPEVRDDQYHYWDRILQRIMDKDDNLVLNFNGNTWEWKDLINVATEVLISYAEKLCQQIRPYFTRFDEKMPVVFAGGGTIYEPLAERLMKLMNDMKFTGTIAKKEASIISAATGYKRIARQVFGKKGIGIDIGNNTTITLV